MEISKIQRMKCGKGLTLIELLIVIVIVGILAAIAIPMYSNYMIRARRADAKTALEQLRASQEMRRAERGSYETNIVAVKDTWGGPGDVNFKVGDYTITMLATSATFTGTATPNTSRQTPDGPLTIMVDSLNPNGVKAPADKWAK